MVSVLVIKMKLLRVQGLDATNSHIIILMIPSVIIEGGGDEGGSNLNTL